MTYGLLELVTRTVNGKIENQCRQPKTSHAVRRREVSPSGTLSYCSREEPTPATDLPHRPRYFR